MWWKKEKKPTLQEHPDSKYRPRYGNCPGCGVSEEEWCDGECLYIDPADYR